MKYKPKKLFLGAFIKELIDTVEAGIKNNVKIKVELENLPKTILSDAELLFQIFENLLSNAVKYSKDKQEVLFQLSFHNDKLKGIITDNGVGIPETEQSQLFDRFFRGENVGLVEGSGLGLSIVKQCVEVLKGEIDFRSQPRKETVFEVTIPVN